MFYVFFVENFDFEGKKLKFWKFKKNLKIRDSSFVALLILRHFISVN